MKKNFLLLCFALSATQVIPQPTFENVDFQVTTNPVQSELKKQMPAPLSITDTIHVDHYQISIDTLDFTLGTIRANTVVTVVSKQNAVSSVPLSLLQLVVDSVILPTGQATYTYNDTTLRVLLPSVLNVNDTISFTVFYHGSPKQDGSGWGGFYFSGNYAFNLGVGFDADPHNFGRVWFPCIDEFTDRSSYDFFITTDPSHKAFCNGNLISENLNGNGTKTWHWKLTETIPTYLASIAVAPFYTLQRTSANLPVVWACMPADTVKTLNTFSNIDTILSAFINAYGPYPFGKVGFVEIPFNGGAMEHATSIHIGKGFIDGTKTYETLWGHELSHMWWGDLVTCETAGDMWLNEGFASFNEAFLRQVVAGIPAYKDWIRSNHRQVIQFTHTPQKDGAYHSLINIPQNITYGQTVYLKGADVVHTLRHYMGDSLFFNGCKYHLNTMAYGNSNSYQLRDNLASSSGLSMNRFFDDWVFTPGFPHFSIDSVNEYIGAFNHYFIHTRQRTRGNSHLYAMPVEINLTDGVNDTTVTAIIDSLTNTIHVALLFTPTWISIDRNEKISDAITDFEKTITNTGNAIFPETFVTLNVLNSGNNSSKVRIEHNWVTPDPFKGWNQGIRLSDYRYWKVDGIFDSTFLSKAVFTFNGTTSVSTGYLDNTLILPGNSEDSLVILYRPNPGSDWKIVNGFTVNKGPVSTDRVGTITVDTIKKGEYVMGIYDYSILGNDEQPTILTHHLKVVPNPATKNVEVIFEVKIMQNTRLNIVDSTGKLVMTSKIKRNQTSYIWDSSLNKPGVYHINLVNENKTIGHSKVILSGK